MSGAQDRIFLASYPPTRGFTPESQYSAHRGTCGGRHINTGTKKRMSRFRELVTVIPPSLKLWNRGPTVLNFVKMQKSLVQLMPPTMHSDTLMLLPKFRGRLEMHYSVIKLEGNWIFMIHNSDILFERNFQTKAPISLLATNRTELSNDFTTVALLMNLIKIIRHSTL
jgi:hypothetical protein